MYIHIQSVLRLTHSSVSKDQFVPILDAAGSEVSEKPMVPEEGSSNVRIALQIHRHRGAHKMRKEKYARRNCSKEKEGGGQTQNIDG